MSKFKILSLSLLLFVSACSNKQDGQNANIINSVWDMNSSEYTIGLPNGTHAMTVGEQKFSKATLQYFNSLADGYAAVQYGKIDGFLFDGYVMRYAARKNNAITVLDEPVSDVSIVIGFPKRDKYIPLVAKVNEFIAYLEKEGIAKEMETRWFIDDTTVMPDIPQPTNPTSKLIAVTEGLNQPMNFYGSDGELAGYDVEFIKRFAAYSNTEIEIQTSTYTGLLAAIDSATADMLVSSLNVTAERGETVYFSDEYVETDVNMMISSDRASKPLNDINSVTDLTGKKVGVIATAAFQQLTERFVNGAIYYPFNDTSSLVQGVRSGVVDAIILDEPVGRLYVSQHAELRLADVFDMTDYGFPMVLNSPLVAKVNSALSQLRDSGELQRIIDKWIDGPTEEKVLGKMTYNENYTGTAGVLRYAFSPNYEPMSYSDGDGKNIGLEVEIVHAIANILNMTVEEYIVEFDGILLGVSTGKYDIGSAAISITPERQEVISFNDSHYKGGLAIVTYNHEFIGDDKSFFASMKDSFKRTFIVEDRWKLVLKGLLITITIAIFAAIFGTLLSIVVVALRRSKNAILNGIARWYVYFFQGIPILVILMILYYLVFASSNINGVVVAIIGFALNFAAYASEMIRTGLDNIDKGQTEASKVLGLNKFQMYRKVIAPQVLQIILPVYKGEFISMLKMTSIVGYIAIQDLTKMSDIIRSKTYEAFFPLITTAIIYFVTAHLLTYGIKYIEMRIDPLRRVRKINGVVEK